MNTTGVTSEEEFQKLYAFLETEIPKLFLVKPNHPGAFGVGEEFDDGEFIASFLMPFDAYSPAIASRISSFLQSLHYPWVVCGSFDLCEPFTSSGQVNTSPRFWISESGLTGEVNPTKLIAMYGSNLRKANGSPA